MVKYILKRIGLSVIILLGVSIIIYFLVRLMPTDYLETKFSAQLREGTMTQEKLDEFRKNYGLYMPESYYDLTFDGNVPEGSRIPTTLRRDVKKRNYEDVSDIIDESERAAAYEEFAIGSYSADQKIKIRGLFLNLAEDKTFTLGYHTGKEGDVVFASGNYTYDAFGCHLSGTSQGSGTQIRVTGECSTESIAEDSGKYMNLSLNISLGTEEEATNLVFRKKVGKDTTGAFVNSGYDASYLTGTYENGTKTALKDPVLVLDKDGTYSLRYKVEDRTVSLETGTFVADEKGVTLSMNGSEQTFSAASAYSEADTWDKAGAVLSGYFSWLGNLLRGNLGDSFIHQRPVGEVIADHMWISFAISFVALVLEFVIAIPMGITSATHQYSARDYMVTIITMLGISLPSFFFAALLIKVFSSWLGWFPTAGLVSGGASAVGFAHVMDMLWHLALPMTVLVVLSIGGMMRYTRTNMLEVLNSDYIRTARAKGLSEKKVIYVHAFRNTMIPLMTLVAGILPSLFGGAMIIEEVFAIDGIGRLAYKALLQGDVPFIMGYNMFLAVLTVIGTLLSDLMYAVVDPRVKLSK